MRVLFYLGANEWSATARAMLDAARSLALRGHPVSIACCNGTRLEAAARAAEIETIIIDGTWFGAGGAWDLRKTLQARFIEVAVVTSDADHRIVASAMRFADRGGVLRRMQAFEKLDSGVTSKLSLKLAPSGLLVSSREEATGPRPAGWMIPTCVAPLGVDVAAYDSIAPPARADIGAPAQGLLIVCNYDRSGRHRIAAVMRAIALLAPRHPHVHAVVVGPESDDDGLQMHASALGVGQMMSFLGERDDAVSVMRCADIGWVVSGGDAGALACLDFMALRVPVVTDRRPLTKHYVVPGETGVLLRSDDGPETASALAAIVGSADRRTAMGNAGHSRAQSEFSDRAAVDGFEHAVNVAGDRTTWPTS